MNDRPRTDLVGAAIQITSAVEFDALRDLVSTVRDLVVTRQVEQTKRAEIARIEEVQVERIRAAEATLRLYLDRVFDERRQTVNELFVRLDSALATGDPMMVQAVTRGIVEIAQESPLNALGNFGEFWAQLGTPDDPIEL